ncbi:MAG TPA: magnesium-translocating P-type ATPase [Acidimicrobiales bacterium]|nr:magnesium-translocating P-type ATPase [Acidimicrobiales bacterium]
MTVPTGASQAAAAVDAPLDLGTAAALSGDEVLQRLDSSAAGLASTEASRRLDRVGPNAVQTHTVSAASILVNQLRNPLLLLLLAAAAVSGFTGDATDSIIIGVIVALSVGLGFLNEYRAAKAVEALHDKVTHTAQVWRDGTEDDVDVTQLVPGDVVALRIGEIVPADLRLLEANDLECDESLLTGESMPVAKSTTPVTPGADVPLSSCLEMGTIVHAGSGRGVVVRTGAATDFGKIAKGLDATPPQTAFEAGLSKFSKMLAAVAVVVAALVVIINVVLGRTFLEALMFSLAIAIGMTPEMMPAVVTLSLSAGSRALADKRVLVKRLGAIEDLGNVQILFTDKTGTLTEGKITFKDALDAAGAESTEPLRLGLLCNEAAMTTDGPVGGNDLDQALLLAGRDPKYASLGSDVAGYRRLGTLPFDNGRQMSSVLVTDAGGVPTLITKGAPEALIARCSGVPSTVQTTLQRLFEDGERVVAIASRSLPGSSAPTTQDERDLTFSGFLTFFDRPKPDAGSAVKQLHDLGIEVKIITGDNGIVAAKVCNDIGITVHNVMNGPELAKLDDAALAKAIPDTTVFARIDPEQKSRIIKAARADGTDVAFMGDGVNDAVALRTADVGISVDTGTDVAKDAADVVMLDKDLDVLATGISEGRRVFTNTMKYVLMASSSNFGNMFSAAGASLIVSYLPMLPSQILLNNLLYDTGQLAIPTDNVDPEAVARPATFDVAFIRRFMFVFGSISSIFDFLTFWVMLSWLGAGMLEFRTGWFVESILTQTLIVYVIRTRRVPFFRSRPSVPMIVAPLGAAAIGVALPFTGLSDALGFTALPVRFLVVLAVMIVLYAGVVEVAKIVFYRSATPKASAVPSTTPVREKREVRRRASGFTARPQRAHASSAGHRRAPRRERVHA